MAAAVLLLSACGANGASALEITIAEPAVDGAPELGGTYAVGDEVWAWSRSPGKISIVDPSMDAVTKTLDFSDVSYVTGIVEHDGKAYVPTFGSGVIVVDIETRERIGSLSTDLPFNYDGAVVANGRLFATGDRVDVFDLATEELIEQVDAGKFLQTPVLVDGQVWVSSGESNARHTVTVIDPVNLTTRFIDLGTSLANPPAVGEGIAWITHFSNFGEDGIVAIDTTTLEVIDERRHGSSAWAVGINGNLWTGDRVNQRSGEIIVLNPDGKQLATFEVAADVLKPVVGSGIAWVPNGSENEVIAVDIATLTVLSTTSIKGEPVGAVFADSRVWIDDMSGTLSAIKPPAAE